mmetsp:Transcript_32395/g.75524  ORF Transcript_32395/g.75524 Transcript_32395/m.75524 type:complete len:209 (-) Transcript_32395:188-814(-)
MPVQRASRSRLQGFGTRQVVRSTRSLLRRTSTAGGFSLRAHNDSAPLSTSTRSCVTASRRCARTCLQPSRCPRRFSTAAPSSKRSDGAASSSTCAWPSPLRRVASCLRSSNASWECEPSHERPYALWPLLVAREPEFATARMPLSVSVCSATAWHNTQAHKAGCTGALTSHLAPKPAGEAPRRSRTHAAQAGANIRINVGLRSRFETI